MCTCAREREKEREKERDLDETERGCSDVRPRSYARRRWERRAKENDEENRGYRRDFPRSRVTLMSLAIT